MNIRSIEAVPLYLKFKEPYYWAQGTNFGAKVVLITIETECGLIGYGESIGAPNCEVTVCAIEELKKDLLGRSVDRISEIVNYCHQALFASQGPGNHRRLSLQVSTGIELALWDLLGKEKSAPVHHLLGGAVRESIEYFGFAQGNTPESLAKDAARYQNDGFQTVYIKIGRGAATDVDSVSLVRNAIGAECRLRADANESWDILTARRMIKALEPYDLEMIEQPINSSSHAALGQLRNSVSTPIAADQSVHTIQDIFELCMSQSADLIVLGLHECGGILNFLKCAAVAEAGGLNICIHGNFESGITSCAAHQVALTIPNLDDANQIMGNFLARDIVKSPALAPVSGKLAALCNPGLGFDIDADAVGEAEEAYRRWKSNKLQ